jgi:hypothetical protein
MEILIVDKYADGTVLAVFGMLYIAIPVSPVTNQIGR